MLDSIHIFWRNYIEVTSTPPPGVIIPVS